MRKAFLWATSVSLAIGTFGFLWVTQNVDVTQNVSLSLMMFALVAFAMLWGALALVGYGVRSIFSKDVNGIVVVSGRQSFLMSLLVVVNFILQGLMLWNVFTGLMVTLIIGLSEYYFLSVSKA
jgi:hypothetical protein